MGASAVLRPAPGRPARDSTRSLTPSRGGGRDSEPSHAAFSKTADPIVFDAGRCRRADRPLGGPGSVGWSRVGQARVNRWLRGRPRSPGLSLKCGELHTWAKISGARQAELRWPIEHQAVGVSTQAGPGGSVGFVDRNNWSGDEYASRNGAAAKGNKGNGLCLCEDRRMHKERDAKERQASLSGWASRGFSRSEPSAASESETVKAMEAAGWPWEGIRRPWRVNAARSRCRLRGRDGSAMFDSHARHDCRWLAEGGGLQLASHHP